MNTGPWPLNASTERRVPSHTFADEATSPPTSMTLECIQSPLGELPRLDRVPHNVDVDVVKTFEVWKAAGLSWLVLNLMGLLGLFTLNVHDVFRRTDTP